MARSQQSFSKKEKEKQRNKKKQDKLKKKEERKSAGTSSFDDMIAYVDEFGNITDSPPDPAEKEEIQAEDIELGVPSRKHDPEDLIHTGTVTFFDTSKGYGFIKDHTTQDSLFTHVSNHQEEISERDTVTFEIEKGPKGLNAVNVKKVVKK